MGRPVTLVPKELGSDRLEVMVSRQDSLGAQGSKLTGGQKMGGSPTIMGIAWGYHGDSMG